MQQTLLCMPTKEDKGDVVVLFNFTVIGFSTFVHYKRDRSLQL